MSNQTQANDIYRAHSSKGRKVVMGMIQDELMVSTAYASTLYANAKKKLSNTNYTPVYVPNNKLQAAAAVDLLRPFIGQTQLTFVGQLCYGEERQYFIDKLVELGDIVKSMPTPGKTNGQGMSAIAYLHYFHNKGMDFYITEKDVCENGRQHQAFGWADMGYGGELGYISIEDLLANECELDFAFTPKKLSEIVK